MPNQEEILHQQDLLSVHRRSLAQLLKQQAMVGMASADQATVHNIRDARDNIRRIKTVLREWGLMIEDLPDDDDSDQVHGPLQPPILPRASAVEPAQSQTVREGLIALSELMRAPEVRARVANMHANVQVARKQIEVLNHYKSIHDLFQVMEICYTPISPAIYRNNELLPSDEIGWDVLDYQISELQGSIESLLYFAVQTPFVAEAAAWRSRLERARSELTIGIRDNEPEQIKNATNRIKVVLYRELSRVNNSLVAAAKAAQLPELVQAMQSVRDDLAELILEDLAKRRFRAFEAGMDTLAHMVGRLSALIEHHDRWQAIDDELRRVETSVMYELADAWLDVWPMIQELCGASDEDWAKRLHDIGNELEAALTMQNPIKVRRVFRDFRGRATIRFNQVDKMLLRLCDEFQKVGDEPLAAVLRMLE